MIKNEHKNLSPIEIALLTWYEPDNPLYKNPEHPTVKLAGEIGELLDLWAKNKYKPKFSWLECKSCGDSDCVCDGETLFYTPLVLDELGDVWYYLRILAWLYDVKFLDSNMFITISDSVKHMYHHADNILNGGMHYNRELEISYRIQQIYNCLLAVLEYLDTTIEDLTLINYRKLVLDETNHGWKDAR